MKTRPLALALLVSLAPAAAFPPRAAFAQAADDATTKMARQRFQEGVGFYDKGQFEMARAAFLQAYALRKHPTVLLNLAQSSLKSGHTLDAAHYFQQFLKEYSQSTEAQRADATRGLGEARMKLGRIDVLGATVGADVFVDDERVGMAPLDHSVDVEPGTHVVRSQGVNGEQSLSVTANAGQGAVARFNAATAAPAPTPPPSSPTPEPTPEPSAPPPAPEEPAQAQGPSNQPSPPEESRSHPWGWVIASAVVTAGGFIVSGVFANQKASAQDNANTLAAEITTYFQSQPGNAGKSVGGVCYAPAPGSTYASPCAALASDNNNVNADATVANVAAVVGAVGFVGLVVSTVFTVRSYGSSSSAKGAKTEPPFTVTPIFGKGVGGVGIGGSF